MMTKALAVIFLVGCGSGSPEQCPVQGDPYQQACTTNGQTCQGTTSCSITPVQTFTCTSGAWLYEHGSPENCGDVAGDSGHD